jgi:hypothetical protein
VDGPLTGSRAVVRLALTRRVRSPMRLLLIDHGCCDLPDTRIHAFRLQLSGHGVESLACGPSSVPSLAEQSPGLYGLHLHDIAAANRKFHEAVLDGSPAAFLTAVAGVSPGLLGLVREAARQTIAEAVDAFDPDAIFVLNAGILADLAVETGVPVVLHISRGDLLAAGGSAGVRALVASAVGSAKFLVADDGDTAAGITRDWLDRDTGEDDPAAAIEVWSLGPDSAANIIAACEQARRL